jgi:hypothetical protein
MKWVISILVAAVSINVAAQVVQNREPEQASVPEQASLQETMSWMASFSASHGYLLGGKETIRLNFLSGPKGCAVSFETRYPTVTKGFQIKHAIAKIHLGDFAPNSVREETDKEGDHRIVFERSDGSAKTEEITEMADGTRLKTYPPQLFFSFDSEESAKRFSRALALAITLCGGRPSAF